MCLLAYIDPTGGLPPPLWHLLLTAIAAGVAAFLGAIKLFGFRVRRAIAAPRSRVLVCFLFGLTIGVAMTFLWGRRKTPTTDVPARATQSEPAPRVLVLAFDGLDPQLLDEYLRQGRLPNFARLAREGVYHPLPTALVPQSPVAWCTFLTGEPPTGHGVYDFIRRHPETYLPDLSLADRRKLSLPWKGRPLWERPAISRLGFTAVRLPMVFPPPKLNGRLLAGMGVWDVRGTEGTYVFYSSPPTEDAEARGLLMPLQPAGDDRFTGELPGPYRVGQADDVRVPFELRFAGESAVLKLADREQVLPLGRWSDWISVEFRLGPLGLERIPATTRVLCERNERVSLYVSPLQFDPRAPAYPISFPRGYAAEMADAIGLYATRGMPFDTQAVNDGLLTDERFLDQVRQLADESERMLFHELTRFRSGVLFAYFEHSDIVQHMFWRGIDPEHPLHADPETQRHRDAIPRLYEECDAILGRARVAVGDGAEIVVMSDHGFAPFRTAVHLNAVLRELGFLSLRDGQTGSAELLRDVDWSKTRAYALGFNSVYLNVAGRESQGIVPASDAARLAAELSDSLRNWTVAGERPCKSVHVLAGHEAGRDDVQRPDLIVGYVRGFRSSWQTALGAVPTVTTEPNRKKWSGDHCMDCDEVPGIFLSTHRGLDAATLADVGRAIDAFLHDEVERNSFRSRQPHE